MSQVLLRFDLNLFCIPFQPQVLPTTGCHGPVGGCQAASSMPLMPWALSEAPISNETIIALTDFTTTSEIAKRLNHNNTIYVLIKTSIASIGDFVIYTYCRTIVLVQHEECCYSIFIFVISVDFSEATCWEYNSTTKNLVIE